MHLPSGNTIMRSRTAMQFIMQPILVFMTKKTSKDVFVMAKETVKKTAHKSHSLINAIGVLLTNRSICKQHTRLEKKSILTSTT